MIRVAIDPGINTGIAIRDTEEHLSNCASIETTTISNNSKLKWEAKMICIVQGAIDHIEYHLGLEIPFELYIEFPKFFAQRLEVAESESLVKLAAITGALIARINQHFSVTKLVLVHPDKWKGQLNKTITRKRVARYMDVKGLTSHEVDAAGILLWAEGRF